MIAVGGTEKMHRTVRSCVLRGLGPGDAAAEVSMKKMLRSVEAILDASGKRDNEKRAYAAHWWKSYLLICDWLAPKRGEDPDSRPCILCLARDGVRSSRQTSWEVFGLQDLEGVLGRRVGLGRGFAPWK